MERADADAVGAEGQGVLLQPVTGGTGMKVLYLHGWTSAPGGVKPAMLRARGHEVVEPALDRRARTPTMLGVLEAHCARGADGSLAAVRLAGDLLAPSGAVTRLEAALRGCPVEVAAVQAVVARVIRPPRDFVLGIGPLRTIAETIVRAAA